MSSTAPTKVAVVIPTLNADGRWQECLASVSAQSLQPNRRLVIDSASSNDTVAQARDSGFEVKVINRGDFNHGGTRQWAVEYLDDCEIVAFLTQDAILASTESLADLARCLSDPKVAVAYGRQLPHRDAKAIEAHARLFNYGEHDQRKDLKARPALGARTFFCSNSFAAYRRSTLLRLGGFRKDLILGEDAEYAARAVLAGYANVYCSSATAYHSHDYSVAEVFWRYFDTGVFHATNPWLAEHFGSHGAEGLRFVNSELRFLSQHAPWQIPRAMCHSIAKFVGYRLGRQEKVIPNSIKRWLSMTPNYWKPQRF